MQTSLYSKLRGDLRRQVKDAGFSMNEHWESRPMQGRREYGYCGELQSTQPQDDHSLTLLDTIQISL